MLNDLKDMNLIRMTHHLANLQSSFEIVDRALAGLDRDRDLVDSAKMAYKAWLGFYNSNLRKCKLSQTEVVQQANN